MSVCGGAVWHLPVAWDAGFMADRKYLWTIPGGGDHEHGGVAGIHNHQRSAGNDAEEGDSAAIGVVRRVVVVRDAGMRGRTAEYYKAGGVRKYFATDLHGSSPIFLLHLCFIRVNPCRSVAG